MWIKQKKSASLQYVWSFDEHLKKKKASHEKSPYSRHVPSHFRPPVNRPHRLVPIIMKEKCRSKRAVVKKKEIVLNAINNRTVFGWITAHPCPSFPSPELTGTLEFIDDFFLLYAPVLKPDCHLSLSQICLRGYPSPFVLGDEFIGGILSFQFFELHLGVWHTLLSSTAYRAVSTG